jgi:hypothetical protein
MISKHLKNEILLTSELIADIAMIINKRISNKDAKETLILSFLDMSFEHMRAILFLLERELTGSAFALIRPFYETIFRGLWILSDNGSTKNIEKILNDKSTYPPTYTMMDNLDNFYTRTDFFTSIHKDWWSSLCDYTHTGIRQLSRRWNSDGSLQSNNSDDEIIEVLVNMRKIFLVFTYSIAKFFKLESEMDNIVKLSKKY